MSENEYPMQPDADGEKPFGILGLGINSSAKAAFMLVITTDLEALEELSKVSDSRNPEAAGAAKIFKPWTSTANNEERKDFQYGIPFTLVRDMWKYLHENCFEALKAVAHSAGNCNNYPYCRNPVLEWIVPALLAVKHTDSDGSAPSSQTQNQTAP